LGKQENARWDETAEWSREDIKKAHDALVSGAGMLGVVYRRLLLKNRELKARGLGHAEKATRKCEGTTDSNDRPGDERR